MKWFHVNYWLLLLLILNLCSFKVLAIKPFTREPLLQIETGMHTSMIRRILVDEPRHRVITCSDDKTIRVWQMPEAQLISIIRVPIDYGHEGKLFAMAVSPDGKTLAAAGWTGWDWEQTGSIYFINIASGKIIRRISDLPNIVNALYWMPDGVHITFGMHGKAGVQMLRWSDSKLVSSDPLYLDKVMDIDVSPQGNIVVVALDGMVRLYDKNLKILGRRNLEGGKKPSSIRYSSSGEKLAVGFLDTAMVSVMNASDLSYAYTPDLNAINNQISFTTVAWSTKGDYLYAAGDYEGSGKNPLYRWSKDGKGEMERIPLTTNRINEIQSMSAGDMVFAAEDPGIGVLNRQGQTVFFKGPDIINFQNIGQRFSVSKEGGTVRYHFRDSQDHVFSVFGPGDQKLNRVTTVPMYSAQQQSTEFNLKGWENSYELTINNIKPHLDEYEMSRSFAISSDHKKVLLGTEWGLHLLNTKADSIWKVRMPAVVWEVTISGDSHFALAALSDGTIRWYRMFDGKEVLAYFPHKNGKDWIAWIPEGYYSSSIYGDNFVGWHLNHTIDSSPDFFKAVQFDRFLYRPDVVKTAFQNALDDKKRGKLLMQMGAKFLVKQLREISPPGLTMKTSKLDMLSNPPRLRVSIKGKQRKLSIRDYSVFVNNIPITPSDERMLLNDETREFSREFDIELDKQKNKIRVEAFTKFSMGLAETYISLPTSVQIKEKKGDLYLLAIGVNEFPNLSEEANLEYAAQDSVEFSRVLQQKSASCFDKFHVKILSDISGLKPNKHNILDSLDFFKQSQPNDTVVIFLASHGVSDPAGNYYFVPRDSEQSDFLKIENNQSAPSLLSWKAFFEALRFATGKRLLIVDTCQAKNIQGKFESHSLLKRSASSMFSMLVASKGDEYSQEYRPGKHGLFTYSLINSLVSNTDINKNGKVSLMELFNASSQLVEKLRDRVAPQSPQIIAPEPLNNLPMLCEN